MSGTPNYSFFTESGGGHWAGTQLLMQVTSSGSLLLTMLFLLPRLPFPIITSVRILHTSQGPDQKLPL